MTGRERQWHDERSGFDAPVWYDGDAASAWADGWNAAVAEYDRQVSEHAQKEM